MLRDGDASRASARCGLGHRARCATKGDVPGAGGVHRHHDRVAIDRHRLVVGRPCTALAAGDAAVGGTVGSASRKPVGLQFGHQLPAGGRWARPRAAFGFAFMGSSLRSARPSSNPRPKGQSPDAAAPAAGAGPGFIARIADAGRSLMCKAQQFRPGVVADRIHHPFALGDRGPCRGRRSPCPRLRAAAARGSRLRARRWPCGSHRAAPSAGRRRA